MAAGAGSRFGGDKPLAEVGPDGQSLFEYSVHDAYKAGFQHIIFVVSDQQDTSEFSRRLQIYGNDLKVEFVVQSLKAFVGGEMFEQPKVADTKNGKSQLSNTVRTKPWGTAHAVLVCREYIHNPFVVINADDYYGFENYQSIGNYLLAHIKNEKTCVLSGYKLENTLSNSGGVNRGVCEVDSDGYLESIREVRNIFLDRSTLLYVDNSDEHVLIDKLSIVSMTFWGFVPAIFDILENEFQVFLNETPDLMQDEFYLPETVNNAIRSQRLHVKVVDTSAQWIGITFAADLPKVKEYFLGLTESGLYDCIRRS